MELKWQHQQTLANGASVLRFQSLVDTLWQPGDCLFFNELDLTLPIMRTGSRWLECLQPPKLTFLWHEQPSYNVETRQQQRWQWAPTGQMLLLADEHGLAAALFAAQQWLRGNGQALVLLQLSAPTPFSLRPSRFMVQHLPPGVIAAAPLLEDWGVASRIAAEDFLPGCFQGEVLELAEQWLTRQSQPVPVWAAGGERLRDALPGAAAWHFSLQN